MTKFDTISPPVFAFGLHLMNGHSRETFLVDLKKKMQSVPTVREIVPSHAIGQRGKKKDAVGDLRLFRLDAHVHNHHRLVAAAAAVLIGYIAYESRPRETAADCNVLLHTLCVRISLPTTPASGRPAKSRVISKASRSFSLHHRLRRTSTAHNISNPLRLVPPEKCIDPFSARRAYLIRDE